MDTKMNHIILVPVDFTDVTENAMYQAVNAGKHLNAKVVLLHVIDKNTKAQLKKENKGTDAINDKLKEIASKGQTIAHIAQALHKSGFKITAPVDSSLVIAPEGQASMHQAGSQCLQETGKDSCSTARTLTFI